MEPSERQALEAFVVDNEDLLALEEAIGRFNIFDALGVARAEIRHSNFLAWLLDPAESHGQGDLFLKAVLMDLLRQAPPEKRPLSPVELDGDELRGVDVRREWKNIDLLISCEHPRFVVAVENKIDSGEHSEQLQRYEETVRQHFGGAPAMFVFLTTDSSDPSDADWVPYSYADIHRVLTRTRRLAAGSLGGDAGAFLDHYLRLIGSRFMNDPTIDELCRRIYKNHRQALDLIFERIEDEVDIVVRSVREWIDSEGATLRPTGGLRRSIGFLPISWTDALPAIGLQGDGRSWLHFWLSEFDGKLRFEITAEASRNEPLRRKILERLATDRREFGLRLSKAWKDDSIRCLWMENIAPLDGSTAVEELRDRTLKSIKERLAHLQSLPDAIRAIVPP